MARGLVADCGLFCRGEVSGRYGKGQGKGQGNRQRKGQGQVQGQAHVRTVRPLSTTPTLNGTGERLSS